MEKRKEAGCALAASLLAGVLALPTAALEVSQAWGVEPEAAKDEVVYVKAGADGATQGLYVVNVFDTGAVQTMDDPARYTRVKNLTTTDALVQENGAVQVSTLADQPFYYEGEMDAATPLPWDVSLTYYLDGAQIAPDELAGKSGRLRIEFAVTARGGDAEAAGLADFAESCVMQAQGTFPESAFKVEEADGATVAHVGDNAVISYLVLPGESAVYAIEGDARAFSYEGWQISAMPLGLAIDLAEQDTAQLSDKTGELEDATAQLSDGAASLESGLGSLASGSGDLASGTGEVAAGATELAGGASSLARGSEELQAGVGAAVDGLASVSANSAALDAAAERVRAGAGDLDAGVQALRAGDQSFLGAVAAAKAQAAVGAAQYAAAQEAYAAAVAAAYADPTAATVAALDGAAQVLAQASQAAGSYGALDTVEESYAPLSGGIAEAAAGSASLSAGTADLAANVEAYAGGVDALATQAPALAEGAASLSAGAVSLAGGTGEVAAGASSAAAGAAQLASGAASASSGARELSAGTADLAEAVSGMDEQVIDAVQQAIDDKLGADYQAHSFVDPSNTAVDDVQFIYVVDGVEEPDDADAAEAAGEANADADGGAGSGSEPQGFVDRLLALFRPAS